MGIFSRKQSGDGAAGKSTWARQGMVVTFRAEIMPGKMRNERMFTIDAVLPNGRVRLVDFIGEYREGAFEPINFLREKAANGQNS